MAIANSRFLFIWMGIFTQIRINQSKYDFNRLIFLYFHIISAASYCGKQLCSPVIHTVRPMQHMNWEVFLTCYYSVKSIFCFLCDIFILSTKSSFITIGHNVNREKKNCNKKSSFNFQSSAHMEVIKFRKGLRFPQLPSASYLINLKGRSQFRISDIQAQSCELRIYLKYLKVKLGSCKLLHIRDTYSCVECFWESLAVKKVKHQLWVAEWEVLTPRKSICVIKH